MKKGYLTIIGFTLLALGFLSITLKMIGLSLTPLLILDKLGTLGSFLIKVIFMIAGVIIMYYDMNKEKWVQENS